MKKTLYNFEWQGLEKCQLAKEKNVHIHMDAGYLWGAGWTYEQREAFENELYPKLLEAGYYIEKGRGAGICDMLYRADKNGNRNRFDNFSIYMHPSDFSGYASDEDIGKIIDILNSCKCIRNAKAGYLKECYNISDGEYVRLLARNHDGIRRYVETRPKEDVWGIASRFASEHRIPRVNDRSGLTSDDIDICFVWGVKAELELLKETGREGLETEEPER